jgi:L,D-transpeptidase catalytic domain
MGRVEFVSRVMRFLQRITLVFLSFVAMSNVANALVKIDVDLSTQTMYVASGDGESYAWPISSGKAGHLTPHGNFRALRLYPIVYSSKYNNAPMPHSIFFYGQYAIHATNAVGALGHPASHGCIRLSPADAATLYAMVQSQGAAISIVGLDPNAGVIASRRANPGGGALAYAPHHRARSLKEWAGNPLANR